MTAEFSIIVPAYNVAAYLADCVHSVTAQSFENFELLLVNDGSTDGTAALCERLTAEDARIRYFSKENAGLSHSRNYGLDRAEGRYVYFLDSDDLMEDGTLQRLHNVIENAGEPDVIFTRYRELDDRDGSLHEMPPFPEEVLRGGLSVAAQYEACYFRNDMKPMATLSVPRRAFLEEQKLRFQPGLLHEDELWTPRLFLKAEKIAYEPASGYRYRTHRAGAITEHFTEKHFLDRIRIMDALHREAGEAENPDIAQCYRTQCARLYAYFLQQGEAVCGMPAVLSALSARRSVLLGSKQRKYHALYWASRLLGVKGMLWLYARLTTDNRRTQRGENAEADKV